MKNAEFIALVTANANKTRSIRAYSGHWNTGASRVPDTIATKIGKIIALLQAKVDEGLLCQPNEGLMIYNFQPNAYIGDQLFCEIALLIKPLNTINETDKLLGVPLPLCLEGETGQVINITQTLLSMKLITPAEIKENEMEPPVTYGSYHTYKAPCCFAAFSSFRPIPNLQALFSGNMDQGNTVIKSVAFDSFIEAEQYLSQQKDLGRYIGEIVGAREDYPTIKAKGMSKVLTKIIDYFDHTIVVTPIEEVAKLEDKVEDEKKRLYKAFSSH